jgi:hypothetical protein
VAAMCDGLRSCEPIDPTSHSKLPVSGRSPRLLYSVHAFAPFRPRTSPVSVFPPFSRSNPGNFALRLLTDISAALTTL